MSSSNAATPTKNSLHPERSNPPRFRKRKLLFAVLLGLVAVAAFHRQLLPIAFHWLDVGEPPQKSTAVFVLLGENDIRPFVAAALVNTGYAEEVMFAKFTPQGLTKQERPSHEVYRDIMLKRGVPADRIRLLNAEITNTFTETDALLDYMQDYPDATVTVVTSHYHTRRTRWSLRRQLGDHADRLRFVSAPFDDFEADDWWLHMRGFDYVMIEYIKLLGYWLLFGYGLWWITGSFALLVAALLFAAAHEARNSLE